MTIYNDLDLRFPEDIGSSPLTDRAIIFEAKEYVSTRKKTVTTKNADERGFRYNKNYKGSVVLYVPSISESLSTSWDTEANTLSGAAAQMTKGVAEGLGDMTKPLVDQASAKNRKAASNDTLATFQDVENREFTFTFNLVPSSNNESKIIEKILNFFRYCSLPIYDSTLIGYPYIFHITVMGIDNNYFQFKPAALVNISVEHGDGEYMQVTTDNTPFSTTLTLTFRETSKMYRQDYEFGV